LAALGVVVPTSNRLRKLLFIAGSATVLGMVPLLAVSATPHEPNVAPTSATRELPAAAAAIEQLRLSDTLAEYGEKTGDALALVTAAKIRKTLPASFSNSAPGATDARSWPALLKRATQLAAGDQKILGLIEDVRKLKGRDIPGIGDDVHLLYKMVKRQGFDRAEVHFKAGEMAIVYVQPENSGQIVLFVYDEFNNLICSGNGDTDQSLCRWRPRWDGSYLLDVRNYGPTDVAYRLAINREIVAR
jgi:hypothetical protein